MIKYIHYANLAIDQSNEIYHPTFWCYFDLHGNTTRMNNDSEMIKKKKKTTPVTIAPAKARLKQINRKVKRRYDHWLNFQNIQKHYLKILEIMPKGEEKAYKFQEQQEATSAEVEHWEEKMCEERQQRLEKKYQQLKQDREH